MSNNEYTTEYIIEKRYNNTWKIIETIKMVMFNVNYRVAFFCSSIMHLENAVTVFREKLDKENLAYLVHKRADDDCEFQFPNGSIILIRVPSKRIQGNKVDAMYIDEDISDELSSYCREEYKEKW